MVKVICYNFNLLWRVVNLYYCISFVDFDFDSLEDYFIDYDPRQENQKISPHKIDHQHECSDKFPRDKVNDDKLGDWNTEETCDGTDLATGFKVSVSMIRI